MKLFKQWLLLCVMFAGGVLHGAIPNRDYERKNLVAAYLQDATNPQQDVIHAYNAVKNGVIRGGTDPYLSSAGSAAFSASSLVISDNKPFQTGDFTVSVWVRVTVPNSVGSILFSVDPDKNAGYGYEVGVTPDLHWYVEGRYGTTVTRLNSKERIKQGGYWTHLTVTFGTDTASIYTDGVLDTTGHLSVATLGRSMGGAIIARGFTGEMYDLRIFSDEKSGEYVNKLFLTTPPFFTVNGARDYVLYQSRWVMNPPTRYLYAAPDENNYTFQASEFNGESMMSSDLDRRFNTPNFTFSVWASTTDRLEDGTIVELMDRNLPVRSCWRLGQSGGEWYFSWTTSSGAVTERIPLKIIEGEWKFFTVTVSGKDMWIYMDGMPLVNVSVPLRDEIVTPVMQIGEWFEGMVSDVRFDSRVLSAGEIADRFRGWSRTDDVVDGWDYSLPATVKAKAGAGMTTDFPLKSGERYRLVQTSWNDIEKTRGTLNFGLLKQEINKYVPGARTVGDNLYDGVQLRVLSCSKEIGEVENKQFYPTWLVGSGTGRLTPVSNEEGTVLNLPIWRAEFHDPYRNFVRALVREVKTMTKTNIKFLKVHHITVNGISSSKGEGFGMDEQTLVKFILARYPITGVPLTEIFKERFAAWTEFADSRVKLAWVGEGSPFCATIPDMNFQNTGTDILNAAYAGKMGQRSRLMDFYLCEATNKLLGQSVSPEGYMLFNVDLPPMVNNQVFGDENEEYGDEDVARFGPKETFAHRFQQSMLRAMQMRRNHLTVSVEGADLNVPLMEYTALQLGRPREESVDGSCYLRESTINTAFNTPVPKFQTLRNFEHHLVHRPKSNDNLSVSTRAEPVLPGYLLTRNIFNGKEYRDVPDSSSEVLYNRFDFMGRWIEPRFRLGFGYMGRPDYTGGRACIKVTYRDYGTGTMTLRYFRPGDTTTPTGVRTIAKMNSSKIRTASFFVTDLMVRASLSDDEFLVEATGSPAVVLAARLIPLQ